MSTPPSSSNTKRRRTAMDNSGNNNKSNKSLKMMEPHPVVVHVSAQPDKSISSSSNDAAVTPSSSGSSTIALLVPQLEVLPQLLTVDLTHHDAATVARALAQLATMLRSAEEHRRDANQLGAPLVVLNAMRKFQYTKAVQKDGCACLCLLAFQQPEEYRSTLLQCGAVEAALNAMTVFAKSQGVHKQACYALMNTLSPQSNATKTTTSSSSTSSSTLLSLATQRFVLELNGISRVVQTMKDFFTCTEIQVAGCGLLGNLATLRCFHNIMREARVVSVVAAALEDHAHDPNIVANGNKVMMCLFS